MADLLHPRRASFRRYWERHKERIARLDPSILYSVQVRSDQPGWVDYYPDFPGTIVEKMVFQLLVDKDITFYFGAYWGDMPFTADKTERYRPDFILPEYRIIIEVYGYYWHSRSGQYAKDQVKAALYTASGYKYYILWDYEIYNRPFEVLDKIPELRNPLHRTGHVFIADRPFNPVNALASRMRRMPKVVRTGYRPYGRQMLDSLSAYHPNLRIPKKSYEDTDWAPSFKGLPDEYEKAYYEYGKQYETYIEDLGTWLNAWPSADMHYGKPAGWAYYWWFWSKWADWFNRWQRIADEDWFAYFGQLDKYFQYYPDAYDDYWRQYYQWQQWKKAGAHRAW